MGKSDRIVWPIAFPFYGVVTMDDNDNHFVSIDGLRLSLSELIAATKLNGDRSKLLADKQRKSKKYGIQILDGSPLTMPAKLARLNAKESDLADPVNFAYPTWNSKTLESLSPIQLGQVRNAQARFEQFKSRYNKKSQVVIQRRIDEARRKFQVGEFAKSESSDQITIDFDLFLEKSSDQQIIYGVALIPDTVDTQGDIIAKEEIEHAAHDFMLNSRLHDLQHEQVLSPGQAQPIESYIAPVDFQLGSKLIKAGSWVVATKILDETIWKQIKDGSIKGYSIKGMGKRQLL